MTYYKLMPDGRHITPLTYGHHMSHDEAEALAAALEGKAAELRTLIAQAKANDAAYRVKLEADIQAAVAAGATRIGDSAVVEDTINGLRCWRVVVGEAPRDLEHPVSWARVHGGRVAHLARYRGTYSLCDNAHGARIAAGPKNTPCEACRRAAVAKGIDIPPFPGVAP